MRYKALIDAAREARTKAYSPYSGFAVGVALQTTSGDIHTGCNIENLSFGLTLCAERSAIASAISSGDRDFTAIAIVADSKEPAVPCGACRQILSEFNPNLKIVCATLSGKVEEFDLATIFPRPDQGILDSR